MTAEQHRSELLLSAFIAGISSISIWQRLLENKTLTFQQQTCVQAGAQESANNCFETFQSATTYSINLRLMETSLKCERPIERITI